MAPVTQHTRVRTLRSILVPTRDTRAAKAFYVDALGLPADTDEEGFVKCLLDGVEIMLHAEEDRVEANVHHVELWLGVDDVDAMTAQLRAAGYEPFVAPRDTGWGIRMAAFSDPDGHPVYLQHDL